MKRIVLLLPLAILLVLSSSCGITYNPAIRASYVPPMIMQAEAHQDRLQRYLLLSAANAYTFNDDEANRMVSVQSLLIRSKKYGGFNMGLTAYFGDYTVEHAQELNDNYDYGGCSADLRYMLCIPVSRLRIGLGCTHRAYGEWGNYAKFRDRAYKAGYTDTRQKSSGNMSSLFLYLGSTDELYTIGTQLGFNMYGPDLGISYCSGKCIVSANLGSTFEDGRASRGNVSLSIGFPF